METIGGYAARPILLRYMQTAGVEVLEVTTPDRHDRCRRGKDDASQAVIGMGERAPTTDFAWYVFGRCPSYLGIGGYLAQGAQSAVAASNATREIPVVVMGVGDPLGIGLVQSLAHPGRNVTGFAELSTVLSPKRLELLSGAVPGVSQVAVLWNAADPAILRYREIESAAKTMHIEIRPLAVREPEDFDDAFAAMRRDRPDAMFMITDALTGLNRKRIVQFAAENRLPAIYESRDPVDDGGLISYGPIMPDIFARTAISSTRS
jgi:ABC transporter substrate binding protein